MKGASETQIADAVAKLRASKQFRQAEKELDHVAVCMIGYGQPAPAHFGDNRGRWPVRIAISRDPWSIAKKPDLESPMFGIVVLQYVWTESESHARRLRTLLEQALVGQSDDVELRHAWKDCSDPHVAWPILLAEALRSSTERIDVFGEDDRLRRVVQHSRRNLRIV